MGTERQEGGGGGGGGGRERKVMKGMKREWKEGKLSREFVFVDMITSYCFCLNILKNEN